MRPNLRSIIAVDGRLDQLDRRQHVRVERANPRGAIPIAEIARRRPAGVVDQDVGLRARGERRGAAFGRRDVARDPRTGRPASAPISARGRAQRPPRCARRSSRRTPSRASASAQPRPSPLLAAQTSARRPARPRSIGSLLRQRRTRPRRCRAPHLHDGADRDDEQYADRRRTLRARARGRASCRTRPGRACDPRSRPE